MNLDTVNDSEILNLESRNIQVWRCLYILTTL